jgi:hypothetical protein
MGVVAKNIFSKEKHEKKHACTYFSRFSTVNVFTQSLSTISEKKKKWKKYYTEIWHAKKGGNVTQKKKTN